MVGFKDAVRTTRTVIADSNLCIDIDKLYAILPITEYIAPEPKKRGRKKKGVVPVIHVVPSGSIICAKYNGECKGLNEKGSTRAFKNSITIVMDIKQKKVNFKLSKNGRFQITGNNDDYHIQKCVKYMWKIIKQYSDIYVINGTSLKVSFWSSMTNFKVNIGKRLDRQILNTYINCNTEYISVFETSSGSASVNIKMPLKFVDMQLITLTYRSNKWIKGNIMYSDLAKQSYGKITNTDKRHVSFLVFHTGEVIMTSMSEQIMEPYFNKFIEIINECSDATIN